MKSEGPLSHKPTYKNTTGMAGIGRCQEQRRSTAHSELSSLADIADDPNFPFRQVTNLVVYHLRKIAAK